VRANDFRAQWQAVREAALAAVDRVGESGWLILGDEVRAFEQELATVWGARHAVGCASGLDALEIALRACGLRPGERVLTTPLSAFATGLAVIRAGGALAFCDVDESGLMDLDAAEAALAADAGIRAVVPVHLYGHAVDLDGLAELAERFDVLVVEDCAQAIGATSRGRGVGSVGRASATSFYPTKNLGCLGDGGALLTDDDEVARVARELRDYGQRAKYVHESLGLNSRLDELQAAVMRDAMLPSLEAHTARRRAIAARYGEGLDGADVTRPPAPADGGSVWHLYPVLVPAGERERFEQTLREHGVATGRHYPVLLPDQGALAGQDVRVHGDLPNARRFAGSEVSVPLHAYMTDEDVDRVVAACRAFRA